MMQVNSFIPATADQIAAVQQENNCSSFSNAETIPETQM